MEKKAYAVYDLLERTLSFYYNELLEYHSKGGVLVFEHIEDVGWRTQSKAIEKVVFDASFSEYDGIESTMNWFVGCANLSEIVGIQNLKTDNVVNISAMFMNCSKLESLDLSSFNTEKVHSMGFMVSGCTSLSKLDVSSFDTRNVTSMIDQFAFCSSLTKLDLSNFNTEKVVDMSGMFKKDVLLEELNISNFNVENVKSMSEMFVSCPLPKGVDWITPACLESHIKPKNEIDAYELKKTIYAYCCGVDKEDNPGFDEDAIIPEYLPVWHAFKKSNFDLNKFMYEKIFEEIEDEDLRIEVIMGFVFPITSRPIARFAVDWLNGYLDFFERESKELSDTEVLLKLYDSITEEDIWRFMATGVGDIESLYRWYKGMPDPFIEEVTGITCYYEKDEGKAAEFLEYLLDESTNATDAVKKETIKLKTI